MPKPDVKCLKVMFSKDEESNIWDFFLRKLRKREVNAFTQDKSLWVEYCVRNESNNHTAPSLGNHFKRHMLPNLANASISNEDIKLILDLCKVKKSSDEQMEKLKRRLKCEIKVDNTGFMRVCENIAYEPPSKKKASSSKTATKQGQKPKPTGVDSASQPSTSNPPVSRTPTAVVSPIKRATTSNTAKKTVDRSELFIVQKESPGSEPTAEESPTPNTSTVNASSVQRQSLVVTSPPTQNPQRSPEAVNHDIKQQRRSQPSSTTQPTDNTPRSKASDQNGKCSDSFKKRISGECPGSSDVVMPKRSRQLAPWYDFSINDISIDIEEDLSGMPLTEEQRTGAVLHEGILRYERIFKSQEEEDFFYRDMLCARGRLIAQNILPANLFFSDVPARIKIILEPLAELLTLCEKATSSKLPKRATNCDTSKRFFSLR